MRSNSSRQWERQEDESDHRKTFSAETMAGFSVCVLKQLSDEEQSIWAEEGAAAASGVAQASVQGLRSWVCLRAEVESSKGFQWGERQPVVEGNKTEDTGSRDQRGSVAETLNKRQGLSQGSEARRGEVARPCRQTYLGRKTVLFSLSLGIRSGEYRVKDSFQSPSFGGVSNSLRKHSLSRPG